MDRKALTMLLWASALGVFGWFMAIYSIAAIYLSLNYSDILSALAALPGWIPSALFAAILLISASLLASAYAFKAANSPDLRTPQMLSGLGATLALALFVAASLSAALGAPAGLFVAFLLGFISLLVGTAGAGIGLVRIGDAVKSGVIKAAGIALIAGAFFSLLAFIAWLMAFAGAARARGRT
ncbi:MAG: hypothetical protein TU35_002745 [Thermoproteus sp. AZ2]|jgi:hypothetical protein|uniref:Uncharacterized protein n=1 Tax=Thermoproteus sp. AZ2 TaxID=1609232 RepID=A0ACC6UZK5_9CREN